MRDVVYHRIDAIEVWHFYAGDPLALYIATWSGWLATGTGYDRDYAQLHGLELSDERAAHCRAPTSRETAP